MKAIVFKIISLTAITLIFLVQAKSCLHLKDENRRLSGNVESLNQSVTVYKTSDSLTVYKIQRLQYEKGELEKYNADLVSSLGDMGIRLRNLENVTAISHGSYYHLRNYLKDSLKIRYHADSIRLDTIHLKYIDYKSQWIDFNQVQTDDMADTRITVRDSILIAQTWQRPHRFWFIRWGKPVHHEVYKNFNPYSTLHYFISIDKL